MRPGRQRHRGPSVGRSRDQHRHREFNQFFGWLIPPLPPRPLVSTAATAVAKAPAPELSTPKSVEPVTDSPIDVVPAEPPTKLPKPATPDVRSSETSEPAEETPAEATSDVTEPKVDADPTADTAVPTAKKESEKADKPAKADGSDDKAED